MNFSIITSVYRNDKSKNVRVALDSMLAQQTIKPDEIVLVQDGPVSCEISKLLSEYRNRYGEKLKIIKLEENKGLGNALNLGVENAKYDIIARMDSDDICLPDRFEKQLAYLEAHPDVDIVGGQISEFIDSPDNIVGKRMVPTNNEDILAYMKQRCAFNHMTVMFRKEAVQKVGNYQDWFWNEDYYLWVRMMLAGCKFANLPDTLVNVRVGKDMYARRGSMKYFKSEEGIQRYMLHHHLISFPRYLYNVTGRFAIQVLMPNWLRGVAFRTLFRK